MNLKPIIFCLSMFTTIALNAQVNFEVASISGQSLHDLQQKIERGIVEDFSIVSYDFSSINKIAQNESFNPAQPLGELPKAYCFDDLAIFCKLEVKLDNKLKMPVRFRLGSVQYVDYLEGKNDDYLLGQ